ncbi:hypothetical protein ACVIU7_007843 [Bradyrhizobium liaoningense]
MDFLPDSGEDSCCESGAKMTKKSKRVFYRTGYARGWPRRRVTPGPSSVIGTAWLT